MTDKPTQQPASPTQKGITLPPYPTEGSIIETQWGVQVVDALIYEQRGLTAGGQVSGTYNADGAWTPFPLAAVWDDIGAQVGFQGDKFVIPTTGCYKLEWAIQLYGLSNTGFFSIIPIANGAQLYDAPVGQYVPQGNTSIHGHTLGCFNTGELLQIFAQYGMGGQYTIGGFVVLKREG